MRGRIARPERAVLTPGALCPGPGRRVGRRREVRGRAPTQGARGGSASGGTARGEARADRFDASLPG
jgi:hypothetical protein